MVGQVTGCPALKGSEVPWYEGASEPFYLLSDVST